MGAVRSIGLAVFVTLFVTLFVTPFVTRGAGRPGPLVRAVLSFVLDIVLADGLVALLVAGGSVGAIVVIASGTCGLRGGNAMNDEFHNFPHYIIANRFKEYLVYCQKPSWPFSTQEGYLQVSKVSQIFPHHKMLR